MAESTGRPYVWQMVREAIHALGGSTTNKAVREWILKKYPGTNPTTINCQIVVSTVNQPSRIHYPENHKPRLADSQYDFLYRPEKGRLEIYDPAIHGVWQIIKTEDGRLSVVPGDSAAVDAPGDGEVVQQEETGSFAAEHHLRDYLAHNLHLIEPGLQLYVSDDGNDGVEFPTGVGPIDLLAVGEDSSLVVIELKVGHSPDVVVGQILRYMGWATCHLAQGKPVKGYIIAQNISDKIKYAVMGAKNVFLKEYELQVAIKDISAM